MIEPTGNSLPYHHHAPWSLRKVVLVIAGLCLAVWGLALAAILG